MLSLKHTNYWNKGRILITRGQALQLGIQAVKSILKQIQASVLLRGPAMKAIDKQNNV